MMDKSFRKEVSSRPGGENINYCYSCGSCTACCPVSELDSSYNPRLIIKKVLLGMKRDVLENNNLWKCIQCHRCVAHCPQNVKFADIMRVLREISVEEGYFPQQIIEEVDQLDKNLNKYRLGLLINYLSDKASLQNSIKEMEKIIGEVAGNDNYHHDTTVIDDDSVTEDSGGVFND